MSDSLITIVAVMAVFLIMFLVPFSFMINQNEVITENNVKTLTSTFVNTVAKEGKITNRNYYDFIQKINSTGNSYSVEVEAQILSNYPEEQDSKYYLIGENMYYSEFTPTIEEKLKKAGEYTLKKGDYIKVKVENTNITLGTKIKQFIYGISGQDYSVIDANISAIVEGVTQDDIIVAREPKTTIPKPVNPGDDPTTGLRDPKFKWEYDFWWKSPSNTPFENNINDMPFPYISISNINIKSDKVLMKGNGTDRGKGAAWATVENQDIKSISFAYDLLRGDSFVDGGLIFNVYKDENAKTLNGFFLSLNFSYDSLYRGVGVSLPSKEVLYYNPSDGTFQSKITTDPELADWQGVVSTEGLGSKIRYDSESELTGAIYKFTYYLGNSVNNPANNHVKIEEIELLYVFDARNSKKC